MNYLSLPLVEQLLPIIIPGLVALLVRFWAHLPKWTIPWIAVPCLGLAGQALSAWSESSSPDPVTGVLLGGLALAVHNLLTKAKDAALAMKNLDPVPKMGD